MNNQKPQLPPDVLAYAQTFGHNIKEARLSRGWSQREMAARILVSVPTYINIENGVVTVTLENYLRALDVFSMANQLIEVAAPHRDEEGRRLRLHRRGR
jgi:transcriptional regulator with XRE-family HTH domain